MSAKRVLPELTLKAILLAIVLSVVLGAANTYLGLRVGLTVSASIPAAVISMAILRFWKNSNILENNAVQTAASAGESLAAGVLFTIPALLLLGYWSEVNYIQTTLIALVGGTLGVLFTIPLRRALIVEAELRFPEGVATSEVLKSGSEGGTGVWPLVIGGATGVVYKFMQSGLEMWRETAAWGARIKTKGVIAGGGDLSPALLGVGYIIGLHISTLVFLGGVLGWIVGIPLYSLFSEGSTVNTPDGLQDWMSTFGTSDGFVEAAGLLWSTRIRYMGVGAMLVGGLWTLLKLRRPLTQALKQGWSAVRKQGDVPTDVPRTEREFGTGTMFMGVAALILPITALYWYATESLAIAGVMALLMVVTGFLFSAVGGYMAGLVGSSNNPISGVTILTVLASSLTLLALGVDSSLGPAATILVAAIIACAGSIASDNMQDLKAGYLLGATPRNQQIMQIVGVAAAAFAVAPVLQLLHRAYEVGSTELPAPQAGLMAAVGQGIFGTGPNLPTTMIAIGAALAVLLILIDESLRVRGSAFSTPVMPVAVGIYLPVGLTTPIFLGGLVAYLTARAARRQQDDDPDQTGDRFRWWQQLREQSQRNGVLFASGLIAGEALVGILLAAIIAGGLEIGLLDSPPIWAGLLMFGYVVTLLVYLVRRPVQEALRHD